MTPERVATVVVSFLFEENFSKSRLKVTKTYFFRAPRSIPSARGPSEIACFGQDLAVV